MPSKTDSRPPSGRDSYILWLAERHSGVKAALDEHLTYWKELLSHPFFGDLTRYYEQLREDGLTSEATALLADLDAGLAYGDDDVDNVIHVSFLENLGHEKGRVAWELLTPRLKEGFDLIHGYKTSS